MPAPTELCDQRLTAVPGRIDIDHIADAARWAANQLGEGCPSVVVGLTPGDMTVYHIVIANTLTTWGQRPSGGPYIVALSGFGAAYPWNGGRVDPSYAEAKWTSGRRSSDPHTAMIVAAFLSMTAAALRGTLDTATAR